MNVVLDTSVVISACFWRGAPHNCLVQWAKGKYTAAVSPPLLSGYEEVYEELLLEFAARTPVEWVKALTDDAELVFPIERVSGTTPDPHDEMILECAIAAEADLIVSGDKRHLLLFGEFRGILIVSPAVFMKRLSGTGSGPR